MATKSPQHLTEVAGEPSSNQRKPIHLIMLIKFLAKNIVPLRTARSLSLTGRTAYYWQDTSTRCCVRSAAVTRA